MTIKPNTNAVLLRTPEANEEKIMPSGVIIKTNQDKNTQQLQVVAIGSKIPKQLELTTDSKVIICGGTPIIVDDITYIVATEQQIVAIIN